MSVHVRSAKSRDKVFFEKQISDEDIDATIQQLKLESDPEFSRMMKEHESKMNEAL